MSLERFLVSSRVARALGLHRGVVALETTVMTHGLPPPHGLEVALAMERAVVEAGADPATVGVVDGRVIVGLEIDEMNRLVATPDVAKLNLSNLAATLAAGGSGSTTVATTMLAANQFGIGVFATGGIGGVHRGAAKTDDVSSDLTALARFPVAVVCSGAKAILDLPRTLERLETLGVPVYGYGCDELPAFWRRSSGLRLDQRFDDVPALAAAIREHHALRTGTGVVVANPVPEADELDAKTAARALEAALAPSRAKAPRGRAVTPTLLARMEKLTRGKSTRANIALLESNARLAGRLAVALAAVED